MTQCNPVMLRSIPAILAVLTATAAIPERATAQDARAALETYTEGPVWQIMTFRVPPAKREVHLKNLATVWEHQAKLAREMGFLLDYRILTKWPSDPKDWNVMLIEMFPNMASYDTFWKNWRVVDERTQYSEAFAERMKALQPTGSEWLGTQFAREVFLIDPFGAARPKPGPGR